MGDGVIIYEQFDFDSEEHNAIQLKVVQDTNGKRRWTVLEDNKELYRNDQDATATPPAKGWTCVSKETRAMMERARETDNGLAFADLGRHGQILAVMLGGDYHDGKTENAMVVTATAVCDAEDVPMPAAVE